MGRKKYMVVANTGLEVFESNSNGVFQAAEGSLDPQTHGIETFQGSGRKLLRSQVGNEKLGITVFCFNTNAPERKTNY